MIKKGINRSDYAKIRTMSSSGMSPSDIARNLKVDEECVIKNIEHMNRPPEEKSKETKNRERALKAAKTRALKKQAQEIAEKAAEAEADETVE